jgi:aminoglycoside phosphotransferase (APT) family kinase protein
MPARELSASKARSMAHAVIEHHFGRPPSKLRASGGKTNFVFVAEHGRQALVVRIGRTPDRVNAYLKEQWATTRAREAGIPTARILEVGNQVVDAPYMILEKVAGVPALHHPRRLDVLAELGRYAKKIHSIATHGFGDTFDWSRNELSRNATWRQFLERELDVPQRIDTLRRAGVITSGKAEALRKTFAAIARWRRSGVLNHGDLRLKNVLVDEAGGITALIDWETCCSIAGPQWDLSIALHDLSIDAKESFLQGYGLDPRLVRRMTPALRAFNLVNYAPRVRALHPRRDRAELERLRTRLSAALDLYAL